MREVDDPFQLCGTTIEGKYRITTVVGDGGFGVVYRGVHQGFDEPVAVKCLKLPGKLSSKERDLLLAQLRDEGKLLLRLSRASSGIVQALDIGAVTTAEGLWVPYLVLEWLEGDTLAQYTRKRQDKAEGPLSIADTAKLLEPAFKALAVAHAQKVAHRDVKPQNLFLAQVGSSRTLKVLDFGIAKVLADHPTFTQALAATNLGPTAFTPRYGAPEQFNKKRGATGPWTDVFALALIVVELASGKQALEGDDATELYIASADPSIRPTLRSRGMKAPEGVERVLAKALSVEPKHRYADAGEFWEALAAAIAEAGPEAKVAGGGPGGGRAAAAQGAQEMLGTAEFAAAQKLDVATDVPATGFAPTEAAQVVLPTLPMTKLPTEAGPKLAPTVPGTPLGAAGVDERAPTLDATTQGKADKAPTVDAPTQGKADKALTLDAPTQDKADKALTLDAPTQDKADKAPTVDAPTQDKADKALTLDAPTQGKADKAPTVDAPTQNKADKAPTVDAPTKAKEATASPSAAADAPTKKAATTPSESPAAAPSTPSDKADTGTGDRLSDPTRESVPSERITRPEPSNKRARKVDDPMAETPLPERAPQFGQSKKPAEAAPKPQKPEASTAAAAAAATPAADAKAPFTAAKNGGARSSRVWIAGVLGGLAIGGVVILALSGGDPQKPTGPGKPTGSASAGVAPKPKPTAKPTATASASAAASADAAPPPIVAPEDMVYIPPGVVKLGEGDAAREVTLTKGFFIERNEVTVHAYQACLARRMCSAADHVVIPAEAAEVGLEDVSPSKEFSETWSRRCNEPRKALDHPINCVDFSNAESFCRFRGRRLPTEAEWERAARGEAGRAFAWGADEPDCGRSCFDKNGACLVRGESVTTCTAGSYPNDATPDGLYDLGGNVAEWVADGFSPTPAGGEDPKGDPASPRRVVRGASFLDAKEQLRGTRRLGVMPGTAHVSIGFRCAMDAEGSPAPKETAAPTSKPAAPKPSR